MPQWSKCFSLESEWSTRWSWFEEEVVLWIFIFAKNNIVISPLSVCKTISPKVMMRLRGRQLQLEGTPYSSVMTSANSNITRSGLPLKEKTSFLLSNSKTIICDKLLCNCHSFLTMRVKRVTLFNASLSCEVLSFVSLRDPVVKILFDLLRLVQNSWYEMIWRICGKYWGDFHKNFYNLSAASIVRDCPFDYWR